MEVTKTPVDGVLLLKPAVHGDDRGFFLESYNRRTWKADTGLDTDFVQDNHSRSAKGVLRGLHYQVENTQGKLVRCISGEVFDVAVDLREGSPTFLKWCGYRLSEANKLMLWMPEGMAHGFAVLSESAEILYKATDYYNPVADRSLLWNDPVIGIKWPEELGIPKLSQKDENAMGLEKALAEKPFAKYSAK